MQRQPKSEKTFSFASKAEARAFWQDLQLAERQIILLQGEMGAGKTQSVLWLAERLGAHDAASPSFALHNIYAIGGDQPVIDHFDLFRLRDDEDLESTGFWDVFSKSEGLVIIEWPERLSIDELPPNWSLLSVSISRSKDGEARTYLVRNY